MSCSVFGQNRVGVFSFCKFGLQIRQLWELAACFGLGGNYFSWWLQFGSAWQIYVVPMKILLLPHFLWTNGIFFNHIAKHVAQIRCLTGCRMIDRLVGCWNWIFWVSKNFHVIFIELYDRNIIIIWSNSVHYGRKHRSQTVHHSTGCSTPHRSVICTCLYIDRQQEQSSLLSNYSSSSTSTYAVVGATATAAATDLDSIVELFFVYRYRHIWLSAFCFASDQNCVLLFLFASHELER